MSGSPAVQATFISPNEYLDLERKGESRNEYRNGEMICMSGASWNHNQIVSNFSGLFWNFFSDTHCTAMASDLRGRIPEKNIYTYPDLVILCDKPEFEDQVLDTILNPDVIVEVLSDSTEQYDRGDKFLYYQSIPPLKEYILVSQKKKTGRTVYP